MKNLRVLLTIIYLVALLPILSAQTFVAEYCKNNDGDTFTAIVEIPSEKRYYDYKKVKTRARLFQCDTYEMKDTTEVGRMLAVKARDFTRYVLTNRPWYLEYYGKDWHGRWLVTVVFTDTGETLKEQLERKGYLTNLYRNAKESRRFEFDD